MIPNRIHFIFGLEVDFGGKPFRFIHYLAIRSAWEVNRPEEIVVHFLYEPFGRWWEAAKTYVSLRRIHSRIGSSQPEHFAHKADLLRLEILEREGGIYLDIDTFCINSFRPIRDNSVVLGIEPNVGLCNAVILARAHSRFLAQWVREYETFDETIWNFHGVRLPYFLSKQYPDDIHVEPEGSFFFPTYEDPMYLLLWKRKLSTLHRIRELFGVIKKLHVFASSGGPFRVGQYFLHPFLTREQYYKKLRRSYCLHLWESLWWETHLCNFGPSDLQNGEGLFARLVRDVLPTMAHDGA